MHRRLLLGIVSGFAAVGCSCRSATQITLEISTDVPCGDQEGTRIFVGPVDEAPGREPASETARCDTHGRIGSLVVVPSGGRTDELGIRIMTGVGRSPKSCESLPGKGCIVARRALHFVAHESLVLPIVMRKSCDGVECPSGETCVEGTCRAERIDDPARCTDLGACAETTLPFAGDAGVDGGFDGGPDAPPAVTACGDMTSLMAGSPWPMELGCPFHRGRSPLTGPSKMPRPAWPPFEAVSGGIYAEAVLTKGGLLIVAIRSGSVIALDTTTGTVRWRHDLTGTDVLNGSPLLHANGRVYVPSTNSGGGALYAWDAESGADVAGFPSDIVGLRAGLNVTRDGALFGKNVDGDAVRLNLDDGTATWTQPIGGNDFGSPVVAGDGKIFFGVDDGKIFQFDEAGVHSIITTTSGVSDVLHVRPDGDLVATSTTGDVTFVKPSGASDGVVNLGSANILDLTVADDGTCYASTESLGLWAVDPKGTKRLFEDTTPGCSPAVHDAVGNVFYACGGVLHARTPPGAALWSLTFGDASMFVDASPVIGPGNAIYVATQTGRVVAYVP